MSALSQLAACAPVSSPSTFPCWPDNHQGSLYGFVQCVTKAYVPQDYIKDETEFEARRPPTEALQSLVRDMLDHGCNATVPGELQGTVEMRTINDAEEGREYCVALDTELNSDGIFAKGWGLFVVPTTDFSPTTFGLNLMAPHPMFDRNTDLLAARVFSTVRGFRSLLLATRHRNAFQVDSDCLPGKGYMRTDPSHNAREPFSLMAAAAASQQTALPCPEDTTCGFLQLHGKGASTCAADTYFGSAGTDRGALYAANPGWLVNRVVRGLGAEATARGKETWRASTPETSRCLLVAARNVLGKQLNGVAREETCGVDAKAEDVSGRFAHVEMSWEGRNVEDEVAVAIWKSVAEGILGGKY
ncbi:hypothetical protein HDU96_005907 [Phlyctochytrium bullatum]|nr:hypothetical protein HDU96_005907 [Phlyctochytrium bullatum]